MERYFFNHRDSEGHLETDIDGIVLPSVNTALEEASFAARAALTLADNPSGGCFEIEDGGRRLIARLPYAATADTVKE